MNIDVADTFLVNGQALKRKVLGTVTDMEALKLTARNPDRYRIPNDTFRPNMFKARDDAVASRMSQCSAGDSWVREFITQWCAMSGLPSADADFWREAGFMEAVRAGRDIQLRRYLDEDGWAWIAVRDMPSNWLHRKRLPELTRAKMVAAAQKRKTVRSRW